MGMGMVGLEDIVNTGRDLADRGFKRVNPHFVPRILVNMAAGHITIKYGFKVSITAYKMIQYITNTFLRYMIYIKDISS